MNTTARDIWRSRLTATVLFLLCGLPGVALFTLATIAAWIGFDDGNWYAFLIAVLLGIPGLALMVVGVGKWKQWRYGLVFLPIPFVMPFTMLITSLGTPMGLSPS